MSQISLPWQHGSFGDNLNDTVKLADSENHTTEPKLRLYVAYNRS